MFSYLPDILFVFFIYNKTLVVVHMIRAKVNISLRGLSSYVMKQNICDSPRTATLIWAVAYFARFFFAFWVLILEYLMNQNAKKIFFPHLTWEDVPAYENDFLNVSRDKHTLTFSPNAKFKRPHTCMTTKHNAKKNLTRQFVLLRLFTSSNIKKLENSV